MVNVGAVAEEKNTYTHAKPIQYRKVLRFNHVVVVAVADMYSICSREIFWTVISLDPLTSDI